MATLIVLSQDNDGVSRTHVAKGPQGGLPMGIRQGLGWEAEGISSLASSSSSSSSSKLEEEERVDLLALALLEGHF